MFGWSYWCQGRRFAYEQSEDVDLVYEGRVVLDLLLLYSFDRELLLGGAVLGEVDDPEAPLGELGLEGVHLLDVTVLRVREHLSLLYHS